MKIRRQYKSVQKLLFFCLIGFALSIPITSEALELDPGDQVRCCTFIMGEEQSLENERACASLEYFPDEEQCLQVLAEWDLRRESALKSWNDWQLEQLELINDEKPLKNQKILFVLGVLFLIAGILIFIKKRVKKEK